MGIKLISELKRKNRFKFIIGSMVIAEITLILFGLLDSPYNLIPMFINSLSLGCMWGFIFSYMEGRKLTDILASFMGVSMVISSGTAKSVGLYMMNVLKVNEFWMPALIGGIALPILILLIYILNRLPEPNGEDIESKSKREPLNNIDRIKLVKNFALLLIVLFIANVVLTITRDIKKDFLVNIVNTSEHSNWLFAQIDTVVTIIVLVTFCLVYFIKNNLSALKILLFVLIVGMCLMAKTSLNYNQLKLDTVLWLFIQSLCLYFAFLAFQTIFFERFIACFKIKGNVGFFIVLNDFLGYIGSVLVLFIKEFFGSNIHWLTFYNQLSGYTGIFCCLAFIYALFYLQFRAKKEKNKLELQKYNEEGNINTNPSYTI
ncbi:DUF5690 family protein [Apibacter muscae]|uniref:DUF5690 family protein n=1 Tax=Apibacter muscae TaxID=2509004 RepID=UPI0021D25983|nr:DUF5690 family protein [Apibacter muscae]